MGKFYFNAGRLAGIPFIIDEDRRRPIENDHFIRNQMVDDILNLEELDENSLLAKIRFLKKYKTRAAELRQQDPEALGVHRIRVNAIFFQEKPGHPHQSYRACFSDSRIPVDWPGHSSGIQGTCFLYFPESRNGLPDF